MAHQGHSIRDLEVELRHLDGRGYRAYKGITGVYVEDGWTLFVDHVQGDPFAEPSRLRAVLSSKRAGLPPWAFETPERRVTAADFFARALGRLVRGTDTRCGSGKSGDIITLGSGQEVLARSGLVVRSDGEVEARFRVGLPAGGRRILGRAAAHLLCEQLPDLLDRGLVYDPASHEAPLRRHLEVVEDAQAMRAQLGERGLVAFVADGARLPRRTGVDDRPLARGVTSFEAPPSLRVELSAPNAGPVSGMGLREGVTLIVGGGYHGKSTLLRAIERGVYDHIPLDGREQVVTREDAVKIRAEDGRRVTGVDISCFIDNLPGGVDTRSFSTENASGSTSQAAAIAEALEVGAGCLLLDEDTSATNFLIRDARMQRLVASADEPITPFIERVGELHREVGVSTILVLGGCGDYFDVADTVLSMKTFSPLDVTAEAARIARELPIDRVDCPGPWAEVRPRIPLPRSVDASRGRREKSIKTRQTDRVAFGREEVELGAVEQLVESAQTRAIAEALVWARGRLIDGERTMAEALGAVAKELNRTGGEGLDLLSQPPRGDFAAFRVFELAAFLNRLRTFGAKH